MAVGELLVRFGGTVVGRLRADEAGRLCFAYASEWLASDGASPISLSLPLREEEYLGRAGHSFFANLLPEGAVREAICGRLGISADNDMALLQAIGGECAGALSLVDPGSPPDDPESHRYEVIDDNRLCDLVSADRVIPLLIGGPTTRLSLAGAQRKLPVAVLDGTIHLPIAGAPSTHILKLPHERFAHLPANETFVTGLAARLGLEVARTELCLRTDPAFLLIERYDRRRSDDPWPVIRLHQEDLCQALGLPPARKYEQEGGPTLMTVIEVVRSNVRQPVRDVERLIAWQAFNAVIGNADGHAKNLSVLYEGPGSLRLAPFYDLVCTRQYERLDRLMAMSVGGSRDPDRLGRAQWEALATELEIAPRVLVDIVRKVVEGCGDVIGEQATDFRRRYGDQPILQTLPKAIARRARQRLRALK